ncbi:DUF1995 family protein [Calothrix sp. PCC 6303]|uniref:DUF1995 family protein n=1 Tax=Calothrix sp. PCC 6303 TaxID=1170562 RepID=UPI0002A02817|nr:DUF1995 family protein [Calothrix sp. PCC 6303]AFZ02420.1 protein of unknown function DUF1995-containing protein [Calothrix sp. PCC 6303]
MPQLPNSLEDAIFQAREATLAAIADGCTRLQVELLFPELKPMPVAEEFIPTFASYGDKLKVFFADAGAAALARRDWKDVPFKIWDVGTGRASAAQPKIQAEDEMFLFIAPTSVEVAELERLCGEIGEQRPFVMLNPKLEDSGTVGIGYAARNIRMRFISTIESCYYLRPVDDETALFRCYPGMWEVWVDKDGEYKRIAELANKPSGDELDLILAKGQTTTTEDGKTLTTVAGKKPSVFRGLQRFIKALSR